MNSPSFIKSFNTGALVRGRRFVAIGAADLVVIEAASAAATILGISDAYDTVTGDQIDVIMGGICEVVCGAAITRNARLTSDANGAAVVAAPAVGVNASIGAIALTAGAVGDFISVFVQPHVVQG